MKRKLKRFLMIVIWAIALALSAHARAEEDAMGQWGIAIGIMGDLRSPLDAAQLARGAAVIARALSRSRISLRRPPWRSPRRGASSRPA